MPTQNDTTIVVILTDNYKVTGNIGLLSGARLTDFMNQAKEFIAVTEAQVFERATGEKLLTGGFINVQRSTIEVIMPADQSTTIV